MALSHAQCIEDISAAVKKAARELAGADGATYVLNDGDMCFYLSEDAIGPLWEGRRFPKESCISGWCMQNKQQVAIQDIYSDDRIPHDAYRPTFVKSLVMTPVRKDAPLAAIGTYWAHNHVATSGQQALLQTLADVTAVAVENIEHRLRLENMVKSRTEELAISRDELKQLAYVVSHELQGPLRTVSSDLRLLAVRYKDRLGDDANKFISSAVTNNGRVERMLDALWIYSRIEKSHDRSKFSANDAFDKALNRLSEFVQASGAIIARDNLPMICANQAQLEYVFQELIENAIKFSDGTASVHCAARKGTTDTTFSITDRGIGFDMLDANRIFGMFKRLETTRTGTGMGLSICKRIVEAHGGNLWAQSRPGEGSTFFFTIPD